MHRFGWLPLVVFYNSVILAAIPPERGHDKIREMQQSDNIEGYLYACLDSFLLQPSPQRMHLLEAAEESLWRAPRSTGEKLSYVVLKSNEGYYLAQYNKI